MTADDKILFGQVADELKNAVLDDALYAKAFSDANGDLNSARALYIRLRVDDLREVRKKDLLRQQEDAKERQRQEDAVARERQRNQAHEQRLRERAEQEVLRRAAAKFSTAKDKKFSRCPKCNFLGTMKYSFIPPKGHVFGEAAVKCPNCRHRFDWHYVEET